MSISSMMAIYISIIALNSNIRFPIISNFRFIFFAQFGIILLRKNLMFSVCLVFNKSLWKEWEEVIIPYQSLLQGHSLSSFGNLWNFVYRFAYVECYVFSFQREQSIYTASRLSLMHEKIFKQQVLSVDTYVSGNCMHQQCVIA